TGSHDDPGERHAVEQATLDELLPEAFAAVREASMRTLGQRHFDVQLIGGIALHQGKIAEMRTGEGKTLVATLPAYLNALTGRGVHIVTVNDYLARRDARWMGPIYQMLGLTVGVLQEAARTENGRKAFLFDPAREAASEDQHQLRMVDRRETYAADIVYGTNHEFGFDYLRDNMALALDARVQRERYYAIVDEVDNILIDEARTPLIISGPSQEDPTLYYQIAKVVRQLKPEDYEIDERSRGIALTEVGEAHLEKILGQPLRDPDRPEELTPEQARLLGHVEQAMRADFLFKRNKDYLVEGGKVIIVDEFTGRKMLGRRWSDGLHQAVEAKEGLTVQQDNVTYATITLQNYFRLYAKLAGMSGTALTEAEEFDKIYKLGVVAIPTNLEYQATRPESGLVEVEYREDGQKFRCFARRDDPEKKPVLWRRKDYPDEVYRTEEAKLRSLTTEILRRHLLGQPLLVGTTSVELSERVSDRLRPEPLQRLAQVMLIREAWFEKDKKEEDGMLVPELQPLDVKLDELNRQELAKRLKELGLSTNPAGEENAARLARILSLPDESRPELTRALQAGIRHNVLNAKKHDEESQIIAGAGALGAVTIATNMAGRGVDIKLGGEMAEEVLTAVNRVLRKARHDNPYDYSNEQRRAELLKIPDAEWGIYEAECRLFLQAMEDAVKVKQVGGLHVVGSERHEARRIDNQLRGRAARQGDPGSSQFYLSLEDELMRRFGGQGVSDLMQRLKIDDSVPVQAGLVNKTIEQSQTRVEGYNFDVRKHLLEYDDVLNTQRNRIYEQRDRIFVKEDLTEDFFEMVEAEVARRVDLAMAAPSASLRAGSEGRWRLFAWLEEAQPSLPLDPNGNEFYPSYLIEILLRDLEEKPDKRAALVELARNALESERQHLLETVEAQVDHVEEQLDAQVKEKRQTAELALEALENESEETGKRVEARAAYKAAGEALGIANFQPSAAEMRDFDLNEFKKQRLPELAEATVSARMRAGLIGAIERRIGASLGLGNQFRADDNWEAVRRQLIEAAEKSHRARAERSLAEIERELANLPAVSEATVSGATPSRSQLIRALINMAWGTMRGFDQKTHRAVLYRTQRLTYFFTAAEMVEDWDAADFKEEIGAHLHGAVDAFRNLWGEAEFRRLAGIGARVGDLPQAVQSAAQAQLGESFAPGSALGDLGAEAQAAVQSELGQAALTNLFRQLMLQVIGQLWVEYLTSVEALRTSIGLEAYAQRDPLVAYKSKAFEMFQELLVNMRAGVVARAFTFRPRAQQVEAPARGAAQAAANGGSAAPPESARNLGRNDPCWCGSGKKYKDCHWEADHRQRAAQAPAAAAPSTAASASPALRSASAQDAAVGEAGGGGKRRRRRR
ncbi:MAG: secA, partial [Anaerolineales bacterium]|nr:secA [Anaerolineales bacterium]